MTDKKKIMEFLVFFILFIFCVAFYFYKNSPRAARQPAPIPEITQAPYPAPYPQNENGETAPYNAELPPLLPQNIPYWELD
jgi:hypothetical protein